MSVNTHLDAVREAVPECVAVAFADLGAKMVLSVSTRTKQPQEALDDLSNAAVQLLDGPAANAVADSFSKHKSPVSHAITHNRSETRIYLRADGSASEALCCICSPTVDIDAILRHAQTALTRIGAKV